MKYQNILCRLRIRNNVCITAWGAHRPVAGRLSNNFKMRSVGKKHRTQEGSGTRVSGAKSAEARERADGTVHAKAEENQETGGGACPMRKRKAPSPARIEGKEWYGSAAKYWEGVDATIDGVLGGFGHLTEVDIRDSHKFLECLPHFPGRSGRKHGTLACDCGAGIGRVSKDLLLQYCEKVDIVEQCPKYTAAAPRHVGKENIRQIFTKGLQVKSCQYISLWHPSTLAAVSLACCAWQDFYPTPATYDIIWVRSLTHLGPVPNRRLNWLCRNLQIQWVIGARYAA